MKRCEVFKIIREVSNWAAKNGAFVLTSMCILGTLAGKFLGLVADVNTLLPTLLGLYLSQRAGRAVSAHWAVSKDPNANSVELIKELEMGESSHSPRPTNKTPVDGE